MSGHSIVETRDGIVFFVTQYIRMHVAFLMIETRTAGHKARKNISTSYTQKSCDSVALPKITFKISKLECHTIL